MTYDIYTASILAISIVAILFSIGLEVYLAIRESKPRKGN